MKRTSNIDVLMILRGAVEDFPPTIQQANILDENGFRVALVDNHYKRFEACPNVLNASIRRISIPSWDSLRDPKQGILARWVNYRTFSKTVSHALKSLNPEVVIAFDGSGFFFLGVREKWPSGRKTLIHFHELPEVRPDLSRGGLRDVKFAMENARHADLTVFPEPNRARIFSKAAQLAISPRIVINCPRRLDNLPKNRLAVALESRNVDATKAVLYQGLIGENRGLHNVIRSMPTWPAESCFVLLGPGSASAIARFTDLATEVGVARRVVVLPAVTSSEVMNFTCGAKIGISLYEEIGENERYAASNKLMEYLAVGIPQISSVKEGIGVKLHGHWGYVVDPNSPSEIGEAVKMIFSQEERGLQMAQQARQAHLYEYNYEQQFKPILDQVRNWISRVP